MASDALVAFTRARWLRDLQVWWEVHSDVAVSAVHPAAAAYLTADAKRRLCAVTAPVVAAVARRAAVVGAASPRCVAGVSALVASYVDWRCDAADGAPRLTTVGDTPREEATQPEADAASSSWRISLHRPSLDHSTEFSGRELIVRVLTRNAAFGAEELNTFLGRYGFSRARRLLPATGAEVAMTAPAEAASPSGLWPGLLAFVFTVELDSASNADAALQQVDAPVIDFMAYAVPPTAGRHHHFVSCGALPTPEALYDRLRSVMDPSLLGVSIDDEGSDDDADDGFVPELVVDNLPYWTTPEQIREHFALSGKVRQVRVATSDRSGAFAGCATVRMASMSEAVQAALAVHGKEIGGEEAVCGVLDRDLNLVNILDPNDVLMPAQRKHRGVLQGAPMQPLRPQPPPFAR